VLVARFFVKRVVSVFGRGVRKFRKSEKIPGKIRKIPGKSLQKE
jgi:hypothetical protein